MTSSQAESVAPDFLGEGWGIAAYDPGDLAPANALATGFAGADPTVGVVGLTVDEFVVNGTNTGAVSTTHISDGSGNPMLSIVHDFHTTTSDFVFEVTVTITNVSEVTLVPRYRRVMDWDPEPTPFWDFSSIVGSAPALASGVLEFVNNDGFNDLSPTAAQTFDSPFCPDGPPITAFDGPPINVIEDSDFTNNGPDDQGATFGFLFEPLEPGDSRTFFIYYGVAPTTAQMEAALDDLDVNLYSLAKPTDENGTPGDPSDDTVIEDLNTFAFGFRQVGENTCPDVSGALPSACCLWPPNHKFEGAMSDALSIIGVVDPDGDDVEIEITAITSDEATCAAVGAGGKVHAPDAIIGTGNQFWLRIERMGPGNGRVYNVHFTATDSNGCEVSGVVAVCIPHDQSNNSTPLFCDPPIGFGMHDKAKRCECIDDGQIYDATINDCPGGGGSGGGNGNGKK
jgi:hypothetical protein